MICQQYKIWGRTLKKVEMFNPDDLDAIYKYFEKIKEKKYETNK